MPLVVIRDFSFSIIKAILSKLINIQDEQYQNVIISHKYVLSFVPMHFVQWTGVNETHSFNFTTAVATIHDSTTVDIKDQMHWGSLIR